MRTYLITGCAGFIGFSLSRRLLDKNIKVIGVDNLNDYYDVKLKNDRLQKLKIFPNFEFCFCNIQDSSMRDIFELNNVDVVINLAAQAGVRYSIDFPEKYIDSNVLGFFNILQCCRDFKIDKLVYASSSSVYGENEKIPFCENDNVDSPISLYAATKKSNELMAYTYSHLFKIKSVGLRFFTVYGPWGRPDMALFKFVDKIINNKSIEVYNYGDLSRDFTYIDDIVDGVEKVVESLYDETESRNYRVYNIGNNRPVKLTRFIELIEKSLGKSADKVFKEMQPGDVKSTYADLTEIQKDMNYYPKVSLEEGVEKFVEWYLSYFKI